MKPFSIVGVVVVSVGLLGPTERLDAQAGISIGRGGGGGRASSIGGGRGGSRGSAPGVMSGRPGRSSSRSSVGRRSGGRGSAGMPSSIGGSSGTGTLHPRGYVSSSPSSTNAPFRTVPNQAASGAGRGGGGGAGRAHVLTPRSAPAPRAPVSGVRRARMSPTVIKVPRAQSIPRMGDSIPPLERPGRARRPHVDPDHVHGFRGVDFGYRHARGFPYRFPVVYLPFGYGFGYGDYDNYTERIVIVDHNTATRSSAGCRASPRGGC